MTLGEVLNKLATGNLFRMTMFGGDSISGETRTIDNFVKRKQKMITPNLLRG
jgi:hypothetical protein